MYVYAHETNLSVFFILIQIVQHPNTPAVDKIIVVLAVLGKMLLDINDNSLFALTPQYFPTEQRALAMGLFNIAARVATIAAVHLVKLSKSTWSQLYLLVLTILLVISLVCSFCLPDCPNIMPNTLEEMLESDNAEIQIENAASIY